MGKHIHLPSDRKVSMKNKRVLLIESGRFIGGVIHSLFETHETFTVIEAEPEDGEALINAVNYHLPDVVVLDDTLRFEYLDELLPFLRKNENFRIVIVNTAQNQVDVYQKQQVPVLHSSDLFTII
jgi:DNA-binding NarL/FixJ family response regulator